MARTRPPAGTATSTGSAGVKAVAARAGVSLGTVSNVLNRPDKVSDRTRSKVLAAIAELGFVRNESARTLRAGRSRTLGLVLVDLGNPFFADVAQGVEAVAHEHDTVVSLYNSSGDAHRELRHLEQLEEQLVLGAVVTPVDIAAGKVDDLVRRGTPIVLLDRSGEAHDGCSVTVNNSASGRLVAEHLTAQGHRRVAFVGCPSEAPSVADRYAGWTEALAESPLDDSMLVETAHMRVDDGLEAGRKIGRMSKARRPTAVFCGNDVVALGVLQSVSEQGLTVPGDLALVGHDDIRFSAAAAVPLSTVQLPRELLGRTAAELLFEEIEQRETHWHREVSFQPRLVVRASSIG